MLNASSLEELSEIRLLMDAGICFMMLGGWLDFVLMYCGWSLYLLIQSSTLKKCIEHCLTALATLLHVYTGIYNYF